MTEISFTQDVRNYTEPLVSIIIANYNYGRFLPAAIDSALQQSYPEIEVIVVDDGSTDNSCEIIVDYGDQILPIFKENGGQASALNAGFGQSHGDVVIFLDADDVLLGNTAQRVVEAFQANPSLAKVMYRVEIIDINGRPTGDVRPYPYLPNRNGDLYRHVLTFPFDMIWMATSGNAFAASVLREILPVPEQDFSILADFYLSHLAPLFGEVVFLKDIGAYYRIHGGNNHLQSTTSVNLAQMRQNLAYAHKTCIYIKSIADRLGLEERPDKVSDLFSVSLLSERLISLKLDPDGHPIVGDTLWRLFWPAIMASRRRFDVMWPLRILYMLWFISMLLAPKPLARPLAEIFSTPEKRQSINRVLSVLHHKNAQ